MAKKKKAKKRNPNSLTIAAYESENDDKAYSNAATDPATQSAMTVKRFGAAGYFRDANLDSMVETLSDKIKATNSNDLANLEGMLTGQAYALNAIFNRLTQIASWNIDDHLKGAEILLKLGLRAQSQCRSTIEAISAVKNPPIMGYVKQANITQGPQQINNGIEQGNISRAGKNRKPNNELLEKQDGNQLDTGTQSQAISDDSTVETVGEVNGAKNARGQG